MNVSADPPVVCDSFGLPSQSENIETQDKLSMPQTFGVCGISVLLL